MTLKDTKASLTTALRAAMGWEHQIVEEYQSYTGLPVIVLTADSGEAYSIDGSVQKYDFNAQLRVPVDETDGVEFHRDPANATGMVGALMRVQFDGTLAEADISVGAEQDEMEGGSAEYLWVEYASELYVVD